MQLEWCHQLQKHEGGQTLIVMPLNVMPEFRADAVNLLGMQEPPYCRTMAEVKASDAPIILTNYERIRDGDIDPRYFTAVYTGRSGHPAQFRQQDLSGVHAEIQGRPLQAHQHGHA